MKAAAVLELAARGARTVLLRRRDPLVGSLIVTDRCNLACRHCAVGNRTRVLYPFEHLSAEMAALHDAGVRILFLYGGEPFLWRDGHLRLGDLVAEARRIGFLLVNVVTNGTFALDLPDADLIMVSVDGDRASHDEIRGDTFDRVMANIAAAPGDNLCLYMAVNRINLGDIERVCALARDLDHVRAVSFNIHTPYPGTEDLSLTRVQRQEVCDRIAVMIDQGYPVLNLRSAFPAIVANSYPTPCHQCVVVEDGRWWPCGRCVDVPGLCEECGFFFSAELSLLFEGRPRVVVDLLRTYLRYL